MRKERKRFTPEEKVAILKRHLVDKVPVSELCEEPGLRPTVFYRWQKEFFENGAAAFQLQEDNGSQFIARDSKEFIRISGMTHVQTSPYYPQSNGKIERRHMSLKSECIRPGTPLSLEDARHLVDNYVEHCNNVRLNRAIGYITPKDVLAGRQQEIHAERDRKLEAARQQRQSHRQQAA